MGVFPKEYELGRGGRQSRWRKEMQTATAEPREKRSHSSIELVGLYLGSELSSR